MRFRMVGHVHCVLTSGNVIKVGMRMTMQTTFCARRLRKCEIGKKMVALQIVFVQKAHGRHGVGHVKDCIATRVLLIHTNPMFWTSHCMVITTIGMLGMLSWAFLHMTLIQIGGVCHVQTGARRHKLVHTVHVRMAAFIQLRLFRPERTRSPRRCDST